MTDEEIANETRLERLRRKCDQAWDMAGMARMDKDTKDEIRHTEIARKIQKRITELLIG